jgi:hypothetical protein
MEQSPQSSESLRGKPISALLFASGSSPDGVVLSKNQYNNLGFIFSKGYQNEALVWSGIAAKNVFERDQWVHLASSWDKNEGRIFANGKLLAVSDKWDAIAWDFGNRFALGCGKYGTLALGFSWGNGSVSIYLDNAPVAGANAVALPSELGRYFFIGSNCEATDTLEGMIESVKITLTRPLDGKTGK